jgi:hypothetical protein
MRAKVSRFWFNNSKYLNITRARRSVLIALRALTLVSIFLLLCRPVVLLPPADAGDIVVPVLVDTSRSMRIPDADGRPRIAQATGVPVEHGEGFQVLHYQPGGEYQPHFDFFNPGRSGEARQLEVGGQRVATLVIYLNSVQAGGATGFPKLGLEVAPVKGNAVFFVYKRPDGTLDEDTLHAGLPVERGEKWIATKWLRERPYRRGA